MSLPFVVNQMVTNFFLQFKYAEDSIFRSDHSDFFRKVQEKSRFPYSGRLSGRYNQLHKVQKVIEKVKQYTQERNEAYHSKYLKRFSCFLLYSCVLVHIFCYIEMKVCMPV